MRRAWCKNIGDFEYEAGIITIQYFKIPIYNLHFLITDFFHIQTNQGNIDQLISKFTIFTKIHCFQNLAKHSNDTEYLLKYPSSSSGDYSSAALGKTREPKSSCMAHQRFQVINQVLKIVLYIMMTYLLSSDLYKYCWPNEEYEDEHNRVIFLRNISLHVVTRLWIL